VTLPEDDRIAPPARGDAGLPEAPEASPADEDDAPDLRSLREDVEALIEDGKTYLEAELIYQKTRAAFVAEEAKAAFVFGAVGAAFALLALIGLTVGLIFALSPWLTAWGASAVVVGLLAIGAFLAMRAASRRWSRLMKAIDTEPDRAP